MERYLGLDVGDRRIGVALSDDLGLTAQPIETYTRVGYGPDVRHFLALADQYGTRCFVLGLPLNMDGTVGAQAEKVAAFAEQLEHAGIEVLYEDERMTTVAAEEALLEANMRREDRKKKVDMVAATLILQSWLDRLRDEARQESAERSEEDLELWDEAGNRILLRKAAEVEHEGMRYLLVDEVTDEAAGDSFFLMEARDEADECTYRLVEDAALEALLYDLYLNEKENESL